MLVMKTGERMKQYGESWKRIGAIILAAAVFGSFLFMLFFMASEAKHDCSGEECEICFCLEICEEMVSSFKLAGLQDAIVCMILSLFLTMAVLTSRKAVIGTLITKKVRLNN